MLSWITEHCFLGFCLAWLVIESSRSLIIRFFRVVKVGLRGWPPPHLDADGDWKPEPETKEENKP